MANIYTIFGRYFGYLEKIDVTTQRMRQTTEQYVGAVMRQSEAYNTLGQEINIAEKASNKMEKSLALAHSKAFIYQSLIDAGIKLKVKQKEAYRQAQLQITQYTEGIEEAHKKMSDLRDIQEDTRQTLKKTNPQLHELYETFLKYDDALDKGGESVRNFAAVQDKLISRGQFFSDMLGTSFPLNIAKTANKFIALGRTMEFLKGDGLLSLFGMQLEEIQKVLKILGITATATIAGIMKGMISLAIVTFKVTWPILAVGAALLVLKKIWDTIWAENIGGVQTTFIGVMGHLKNVLAQFSLWLRKTLRMWSPFLRPFFEIIGNITKILITGLGPALKIVFGAMFILLSTIIVPLGIISKIIIGIFKWIVAIGKILWRLLKPLIMMDPIVKGIFVSIKWIRYTFEIIRNVVGAIDGVLRRITRALSTIKSPIAEPFIILYETLLNIWDLTTRFLRLKKKDEKDNVASEPENIKGKIAGGGRGFSSYNNQPNIVVYTNDPNNGRQIAGTWNQATNSFEREALRNGDYGNF